MEVAQKVQILKLLLFNAIINPRRMREGYGTWFVIRCPSSCREQRSLLRAGKVMT